MQAMEDACRDSEAVVSACCFFSLVFVHRTGASLLAAEGRRADLSSRVRFFFGGQDKKRKAAEDTGEAGAWEGAGIRGSAVPFFSRVIGRRRRPRVFRRR